MEQIEYFKDETPEDRENMKRLDAFGREINQIAAQAYVETELERMKKFNKTAKLDPRLANRLFGPDYTKRSVSPFMGFVNEFNNQYRKNNSLRNNTNKNTFWQNLLTVWKNMPKGMMLPIGMH